MSATVESSWKGKIRESVEIPILTKCCFCVPLRPGLIGVGYINLILTILATGSLSYYITHLRSTDPEGAEYPRFVADLAALALELVMTVLFIVALQKKHVTMMKIYLNFEIIFSILGFVYSLAFMTSESASELFMMLFQLTLQIYLAILIYSSIKKMERDGTVKYIRESNPIPTV